MEKNEVIPCLIFIIGVIAIHIGFILDSKENNRKKYKIETSEQGVFEGVSSIEIHRNSVYFKDSSGKDIIVNGNFTVKPE